MNEEQISEGQQATSRDKTTPFLIRMFVKIGGFHRLTLFEEGSLPMADEQQIFTWKDATLREVLTTLRDTAPSTPEYRHPLARYSFRAIYADATNRGRFASKDLGMVYSRDILGEPGTLQAPSKRLLEDTESRESAEREKQERTLEELRFVPGDYLCVAVLLPKNLTITNPTGDIAIKGMGASGLGPTSNGWKGGSGIRAGDGGWNGTQGVGTVGNGRGGGAGGAGGHWRGGSDPISSGRRRLGRGGGDVGRDRDRDVDDRPRVPPPRRGDSPPSRGGWGRSGRGSRRSRSRSPVGRRGSRYD